MLLLLAFSRFSYNDFFWHLALGKWMLTNHSFLTHDIFSYTFAGKLWLNNTWLFDLLLYWLHQTSSFWGLNILRFIVFGATYIIFIKAARLTRRSSLLFALAVFLMTVPALRNFARPEIMQNLFIGFFLYALYLYKYRGRKMIYLLPLIEVVWVNTHGSFHFGPLLVGIFFGAELLRRLAEHPRDMTAVFRLTGAFKTYGIVLAATLLASLINPYGFGIYPLLTQILSDKESLANITEWHPFEPTAFFSFPLTSLLSVSLLTWLATITLLKKIWLAWRTRPRFTSCFKRLGYEDFIIFAFFLYLMLQHTRFSTNLVLIAALVVVKNSHLILAWCQRHRIAADITFTAAVAFVVLNLNGVLAFNTGPSILEYPKETAAFVLKHHIPGPMLNEYASGSELIWALYPEYQVFIDGRTPNLYDNMFYWQYRQLASKTVFSNALEHYQWGFAFVPINSGLHSILLNDPDWALVSFDNYGAVMMRQTPANTVVINDYKYKLLNPGHLLTSYLNVCDQGKDKERAIMQQELKRNIEELAYPVYSAKLTATLALGCDDTAPADYRWARKVLVKALGGQAKDSELYYFLGAIELKLGDDAGALKHFRASAEIQKTRTNMTGLAIAYHNLGDFRRAQKIFAVIPYINSTDGLPDEYYQIYGRTSYQLGDNGRAVELLQKYLTLRPDDKITVQDYIDISASYYNLNDAQQALYYFSLAQKLDPSLAPPWQ